MSILLVLGEAKLRVKSFSIFGAKSPDAVSDRQEREEANKKIRAGSSKLCALSSSTRARQSSSGSGNISTDQTSTGGQNVELALDSVEGQEGGCGADGG